MNTPVNTETEAPRGIGRRIGRALVICVLAVVVVFGGVYLYGTTVAPEEIVAMQAESYNVHRGELDDEYTRFDEASADGATLGLRYTLLDGFEAAMAKHLADKYGMALDADGVFKMMRVGVLGTVCALREEKLVPNVAIEYRDEAGRTLLQVLGDAASCAESE